MILDGIWVAVGAIVQSALTGITVYVITSKIKKSDAKREEDQAQKDERLGLLISSTCSGLDLGIITAVALRDGKTNGNLSKALDKAEKVKDRQQEFIEKQAACDKRQR
jgi:hypothetical protein